jgi:hypothetical protein
VVEILEKVSTDSHRKVVLLDERILELADAALAVQQLLPGVVGVGCQGSRHRDTGDDHVGETVPRREPGQPCHRTSMVLPQ